MIKPKLEDYGLIEKSINEIDSFNKQQEKHSWIAAWILFGALVILIFTYNTMYGWLSIWPGLIFLLPSLYFVMRKLFYKEHALTEKLNKYKTDLNEYQCWELRTKKDYWFSLSGLRFEEEIALLFRKKGCIVEKTKASNDKGVDIFLRNENGDITVVQCKAHKNPAGPHIIRDLYGALINYKAKNGIVISLSGFTKGVYDYEYIKNGKIILIDIYGIIDLENKL